MADEKVTIKAKVAQKIISDGDTSYLPLKGELVAINKVDNNNNNHFSLAIGQEKAGSTELQELNYVEGKANTFYVTAGQSTGTQLGEKATAEGNSVTASGKYSHAEGDSTTASGNFSHAEGQGSKATRRSQHVFGEYNTSESPDASTKGTYVEIVGNGTQDSDRSNARTLDWSGNERLAGKLTVGEGATNDDDVPHLGQIKAMVVSSSSNGLVPAISGVTTQQAIFGAKKVNDVLVPQWLTLSGEGSISIPNVSGSAAGIVPAYGANAGNKFLIIDEVSGQPVWVNAINQNLFPPLVGNNGKYLTTQGGQYVWAEIVDGTSYTALKNAINSPINFIEDEQSS